MNTVWGNTVWNNMAWNNTAWSGRLFDQAWIFAGAGAAAAAVIVAVMALVVGRAVRSRPAPMRYGLLLAALVVLGIVPAVAAASRLADWAFVTVPAAAVDRPLAAEAFVAAAAPRLPRRPGPRLPWSLGKMGFKRWKRRKSGAVADAAGPVVKKASKSSITVEDLIKAKKLAEDCGGAAKLVNAISALVELQ